MCRDPRERALRAGPVEGQEFLDELTEQCEDKAVLFDQRSKTRTDEITAITGVHAEWAGKVQGARAAVGERTGPSEFWEVAGMVASLWM